MPGGKSPCRSHRCRITLCLPQAPLRFPGSAARRTMCSGDPGAAQFLAPEDLKESALSRTKSHGNYLLLSRSRASRHIAPPRAPESWSISWKSPKPQAFRPHPSPPAPDGDWFAWTHCRAHAVALSTLPVSHLHAVHPQSSSTPAGRAQLWAKPDASPFLPANYSGSICPPALPYSSPPAPGASRCSPPAARRSPSAGRARITAVPHVSTFARGAPRALS